MEVDEFRKYLKYRKCVLDIVRKVKIIDLVTNSSECYECIIKKVNNMPVKFYKDCPEIIKWLKKNGYKSLKECYEKEEFKCSYKYNVGWMYYRFDVKVVYNNEVSMIYVAPAECSLEGAKKFKFWVVQFINDNVYYVEVVE